MENKEYLDGVQLAKDLFELIPIPLDEKTDNKELQPCPFCGGEAIMSQGVSIAHQRYNKGQYDYARCVRCGARTTNFFTYAYGTKTRAMAILAWNRRVNYGTK